MEVGRLNFFEIFFGLKRRRKYLFDFEITLNTESLSVGDLVIGALNVKLLVTSKLSKTRFVLRTKEQLYNAPFIGVDIIVVSSDFNKGSSFNSGEILVGGNSYPCDQTYNPMNCDLCPMLRSKITSTSEKNQTYTVKDSCSRGYWIDKNLRDEENNCHHINFVPLKT